MRASSLLTPLFFAATSLAQGVAEGIAPSSGPPSGCNETVDGTFAIGTLDNPVLKRETAEDAVSGDLSCTVKNGILHDQYGRTGSVVANNQFQFDGPPQAGAIYTGGFSVCSNGSLAIGGTTRWWRCMSGDFGNLYNEWIGAQCHEIRIQAIFSQASSSLSVSASTIKASDFASASTMSSTTATGSAAVQTSLSANSTAATPRATTGSASPTRASASGSAASSGSTAVGAAPPAHTGSASTSYVARGAVLGAAMAFIGAALVL